MTKRTAPRQARGPKDRLDDTASEAQRQLLAEALRAAGSDGITTIDARHQLNIMAPAPRIFELRHNYGLNIQTEWSVEMTPEGYAHRCARYVLQPGIWQGGN